MAKADEKYVTERRFTRFEKTFEQSMAAVAKSFGRVDASLVRHEKVLDGILKELQSMREDNKDFRENLLSLNSESLSYDRRIENLTLRIEKLEAKVK